MRVSDQAGTPRAPLFYGVSERRWLALDVLVAAVAVVAALLNVHPPSGTVPGAPRGAVDVVLVLLGSAPIVLRRWCPAAVLGAVTAAVAALAVLGRLPVALDLIVGLASYMVAARLPRRQSVPFLLLSEAALAAALSLAAVRGAPGAGVQILLFAGAAWFVGDSVSARHRYIAGLVEQAEQRRQAEAERAGIARRAERVRIARELHDIVAHSLAVMTVQAGVGRRVMAKRPDKMVEALGAIEIAGRTAQDELGVVLGLLRDDESEGAELAPAPGLADLPELADTVRAAGTPVDLRVADSSVQLSPALELSVYRVIQEALTNVVKHAPGACATVWLAVSPREICIDIADDGAGDGRPAGPAAAFLTSGSRHGVLGMRERVSAFGGSLAAGPRAAGGFQVCARIPLLGGP